LQSVYPTDEQGPNADKRAKGERSSSTEAQLHFKKR
jgi:hypothetical protein